jgi:hypothetical protein
MNDARAVDRKPASRKATRAAAAADAAAKPLPKQAVVVIHGMGEQHPMSTIRTFAEAVWTRDAQLTAPYKQVADPEEEGERVNSTWIVPDKRTGSHELHRITTPYDVNGRRTDFYELYWADLIQGTSRGRLAAWVKELLWRRLSDVPDDARRLYWATWVFVGLVLLLAAATTFAFWQDWLGPFGVFVVTFAASVIFWLLDQYVLPYFGDVAVYVQATPQTVSNRKEVRERGLALLRSLSDDPEYDRIVVVGHSLGSIIAYDLLNILWTERCPRDIRAREDRALIKAITDVEEFAILPGELPGAMSGQERERLRRAQWALHVALRERVTETGKPWKFSDFVTVGSPLTHAEFLIAHNVAQLRTGVKERLFPICPPLSESKARRKLLYYREKRVRAIHHAAPFAATRWTNIFDLGNQLSTGDPFSGRLAGNFGPGIEEHQVQLRHPRWGRLFTHTLYWSLDVSGAELTEGSGRSYLDVLRDAIDLRRSLEPRQPTAEVFAPQ